MSNLFTKKKNFIRLGFRPIISFLHFDRSKLKIYGKEKNAKNFSKITVRVKLKIVQDLQNCKNEINITEDITVHNFEIRLANCARNLNTRYSNKYIIEF